MKHTIEHDESLFYCDIENTEITKVFVEPLLYSVDPRSEYYNEAKRLINLLKTFLPMPSEDIPDDSLLREFIGGSCFKVT